MGIKELIKAAREKDPARIERKMQDMISEGEKEGIIDPYSAQMIRSILEFRSTVVREIMIPRTEIVSVQSDATVEDILKLIEQHGYTRMPVYDGTVDNIIGILNVKDLFRMWSMGVKEGDIVAFLRKPYYIPETKNVNLLLHELKYERHHMAIVIDEYGGTSGLVTIEDLIEEIVGEISDEYEVEEQKIVEMPDGSFLVDGRTEIEEIGKFFRTEIPEGKYETMGGFILHILRKIPATGERVFFGNLEMTIEAADERSIKKIRVRKIGEKRKGLDPEHSKSDR